MKNTNDELTDAQREAMLQKIKASRAYAKAYQDLEFLGK